MKSFVKSLTERYCIIIGFTTYTGTVTAAPHWGEAAQLEQVRPALPESYEALFHNTELPWFLLNLRDEHQAVTELRQERLERAIGAIYRPDTERRSHYFKASLPDQFDAVIQIDDTRVVEPLERAPHWEVGEVPETFPSAL